MASDEPYLLNPGTEMEIEVKIKVEEFIHQHPLTLRDENKKDEDENKKDEMCSACGQLISNGPSYECRQCRKFIIHKSCAELQQQIQHPFHPQHPLTLFTRSPYDSGTTFCDACDRPCFGFVFHCCDACSFDLDVVCASVKPTLKYEGHEQHPLALIDRFVPRGLKCKACDGYFYLGNSAYRCVECNFNVHQLCGELPKEFQHAFHKPHPLSLITVCNSNSPDSESYRCRACLKSCVRFAFQCAECDFNLGLECASRRPNLRYEIRHPFHPLHLLAFGYTRGYTCEACRDCGDGFTFGCKMCNFVLDHKCASVEIAIKYEGHDHSLSFFPKIYHNPLCESCGKSCDALVLRCVECDFNLHVQCHPSFPHSIKHKSHIDQLNFTTSVVHIDDPFTLTDSLVEQEYNADEFYCNVCEEKREPKHPVFYCADCPFVAHANCVLSEVISELKGELSRERDQLKKSANEYAWPEPTITYGRHEHRLTFFEKLYQDHLCNSCKKNCNSCVLRCVECDFDLHIYCHPLVPSTIKSRYHVHLLTLEISSVQDDSSGEFCCDVCKRERNPEHVVYYCAECDFVAHIECVISEVLRSLTAEQERLKRPTDNEVFVNAINEEIKKLDTEVKVQKEIVDAETEKLEELIKKLEDCKRERSELYISKGTMPSLQN